MSSPADDVIILVSNHREPRIVWWSTPFPVSSAVRRSKPSSRFDGARVGTNATLECHDLLLSSSGPHRRTTERHQFSESGLLERSPSMRRCRFWSSGGLRQLRAHQSCNTLSSRPPLRLRCIFDTWRSAYATSGRPQAYGRLPASCSSTSPRRFSSAVCGRCSLARSPFPF